MLTKSTKGEYVWIRFQKLQKIKTKALVTRTASKSDSRKAMISLTDTGWVLAEKLISESNKQIAEKEVIYRG